MATRESINVVQQIGVESVPGTAVAATRRFAGLSFDLGDSIETKKSRRQGAKGDTSSVIHKEWAQGTFSGPLSYVETAYILAGLVPFIASAPGANGQIVWEFLSNFYGNDAAKTYTLESGDDEESELYKFLTIQSADMVFTLDDATISGNCFSHPSSTKPGGITGGVAEPVLGQALAGGVEELAERPISAREVDLYMDDSFATIGTTKITDGFEARFTIGEKRQPKWVLNTSHTSFKDTKEVIPAMGLQLTLEHNAQSRALKNALKGNPVKFFRVHCFGPSIGNVSSYRFFIDFCGKISGIEKQMDFDGIYAYKYDFGGHVEPTMRRPWSIGMVNKLVGL